MALSPIHFLLSFTIIISFVACYSNLQEAPLINTYVDHSPSIDDGDTLLFFKNMINQNTNVFGGTQIVNVNDYGAKGNGCTDDTQVRKYIIIYTIYSPSPTYFFVLNFSFLKNKIELTMKLKTYIYFILFSFK